ncbi:hypothetical protein GCM10022223_56390 [Kineosporia mesophila]|uniref:Uncharacterized protein n=1 Tax=Kineosporia mesophila TaxID=566012 RepID=A0ABP7AFF4_9ACTN
MTPTATRAPAKATVGAASWGSDSQSGARAIDAAAETTTPDSSAPGHGTGRNRAAGEPPPPGGAGAGDLTVMALADNPSLSCRDRTPANCPGLA